MVSADSVYTTVFRAPELQLGNGKLVKLGKAHDAFAFGCVAFSCLSLGGGPLLFPEPSLTGSLPFVEARMSTCLRDDAKTAIKGLVHGDSACRATLADFIRSAEVRLASF